MKPLIIIQARTGSKRFPRKILAELAGMTILDYVIRRCLMSKNCSGVVVATTILPGDDMVEEIAVFRGIQVYRGSEDDVLSRYVDASVHYGAEVIVRITADCPLIDPVVIDRVVDMYNETPADYVFVQGYPDGLGAAELVTLSALERSLSETNANETYYREHVITYILDHPQKFSLHIENAPYMFRKPEIHLSVDEPTDLEIVRRICENFATRLDFHIKDIMLFLENHPDLAALSRRTKKK